MTVVRAVPSLGDVVPVVKLLAVAVEDVGMELHNTLIMTGGLGMTGALGTVEVVVAVTVGREGVGHLQVTLGNGYLDVGGVDGLALLVDNERNGVDAGIGEGERGLLVVARNVGARLLVADFPHQTGTLVKLGGIGGQTGNERSVSREVLRLGDLTAGIVRIGNLQLNLGRRRQSDTKKCQKA